MYTRYLYDTDQLNEESERNAQCNGDEGCRNEYLDAGSSRCSLLHGTTNTATYNSAVIQTIVLSSTEYVHPLVVSYGDPCRIRQDANEGAKRQASDEVAMPKSGGKGRRER